MFHLYNNYGKSQIDRIIAENLRLARSILFLKREVILHRSEREEREKIVTSLENKYDILKEKFYNLQKSYDNIKKMQNYLSEENAKITDKLKRIEKLDEIISSYLNKDK